MYLRYIEEQVIPELISLQKKFSTWWSFKANSTLQDYLEHHHNIYLDTYFCPDDLFNAIFTLAKHNNMFEVGNTNIIIPDIKMQQCFKTWIIYTSDILTHCAEHVTPVSIEKTELLQNKAISSNYYVKTPTDIIYHDLSSMFWLHPTVNYIMNDNKKPMYSWTELNTLFLDFCTTNKKHFTRCDDSSFFINSSSELASLFKFKFFHHNQIEDILKQITKYLGKTNTFKNSCKFINSDFFQNIDNHVFKYVDLYINNYNDCLPYMNSYVDI